MWVLTQFKTHTHIEFCISGFHILNTSKNEYPNMELMLLDFPCYSISNTSTRFSTKYYTFYVRMCTRYIEIISMLKVLKLTFARSPWTKHMLNIMNQDTVQFRTDTTHCRLEHSSFIIIWACVSVCCVVLLNSWNGRRSSISHFMCSNMTATYSSYGHVVHTHTHKDDRRHRHISTYPPSIQYLLT